MAFLDSNLHTRLAIVTENELGLAFPLEPSQKISSRSVHVLFSYLVNKQTDRQTYAGDYIIPRESYRGYNYHFSSLYNFIAPLKLRPYGAIQSVYYYYYYYYCLRCRCYTVTFRSLFSIAGNFWYRKLNDVSNFSVLHFLVVVSVR